MRKIIMIGALILGIFLALSWRVDEVSACANWCPNPECLARDPDTRACTTWLHLCCDGTGGGGGCAAGTYACNSGTGCCAVGGGGCECGTNSSGGCKSCPSGEPNCWNGSVDCQPGGTLAPGQPVETFNSNNAWGQRMCGNIGSAQRITGCARTVCDPEDENDCWCSNNIVTTYRCCGAGTTEQCNTTYGSNYTVYNVSCFSSSSACGNNQLISIQRGAGTTRCYRDWDEDNNEPGDWIYYDNVVCRPMTTTCSCVSVCNSTAPTNLTVVQGSSATSATLSWRSGTGGTSQVIYVGTNQTSVNNNCLSGGCIISGASVTPFTANTNFTYPITGLSPNTTYYFRVVTQENASCRPGTTVSYTTPANNTVTGRVFMDANNNCSTSTPWNSSTYGSLTATLRGTAYSGTIGTDGRFSISAGTAPSFSYLDLSGIPTGYICSTASGCNNCPTISSITSPSPADYPFYLTPRREAWWRVIGGSIYAEGNVRSELPRSTSDLIIAGAGGALGSLMQSTGSLDIGAGALSSAGYKATTEYKGKLMNYDYFAAHMGVTPNTANDWAVDTMNKPANNPNKVFYYINPSGSEASVSIPWTIAAGESYVIFVNGDLRIASDITIANGGFLAFIVNGSVRVSPAVANIGGLYVIDSTLITESNGGTDVAADFQGSVVAWGGVNLGRDLVGSNANSAAERFTYRPDLLTNMPDAMKVFALKWEEVVPGTIGN